MTAFALAALLDFHVMTLCAKLCLCVFDLTACLGQGSAEAVELSFGWHMCVDLAK